MTKRINKFDAAIFELISHKLLGTSEWFVIHHTDCGMELFTDDIMRRLLSKSLSTASIDEKGWKNVAEEGGSGEANYISFLTISNQEQSVTEDVRRIKNHPLVPSFIPAYGYIYDVKSGKLIEVPTATNEGKAK